MQEVAVAGVGMAPFSGRPDMSMREQAFRSGMTALADAGVAFADVETAYLANIFDGPMVGPQIMKEFGMTGLPIQRIENASATGSSAFREAYFAVASGRVEIAMVVGYDDMRNDQAHGRDSAAGAILPAAFFALWAKARMEEYGTTAHTLAAIAAKNWNQARMNPMAQRQAKDPVTAERVLASTMIADPHTSMMAAAVGQGAAAVVLMSAERARRLHPDRPIVRVAASVLESERYTPNHLFLGPVVGPPEMTRMAAQSAYEQAGFGPEDLSLVQVHDAFPIEELMYYELLGVCGDGEGDQLVASGATSLGGRVPFSTDGGLIGRGHPGGPTGLAQIWETTLQLRGEAGLRQVEGARSGLCHMVGGGTVCVIHILERL